MYSTLEPSASDLGNYEAEAYESYYKAAVRANIEPVSFLVWLDQQKEHAA